MMGSNIDPIAIKESRERLARERAGMDMATRGADALLWFAEYTKGGGEGLDLKASVVASSTAHADTAIRYVIEAAARFKGAILDEAVKQAKEDFRQGDKLASDLNQLRQRRRRADPNTPHTKGGL